MGKIQLHGQLTSGTLDDIKNGADKEYPRERDFFIKTQAGYLSMSEVIRLIEIEFKDKPFVLSVRNSNTEPQINRYYSEVMSDVIAEGSK